MIPEHPETDPAIEAIEAILDRAGNDVLGHPPTASVYEQVIEAGGTPDEFDAQLADLRLITADHIVPITLSSAFVDDEGNIAGIEFSPAVEITADLLGHDTPIRFVIAADEVAGFMGRLRAAARAARALARSADAHYADMNDKD